MSLEYAYTAIVSDKGYTLGIAERGVGGYTPDASGETFPSYDAASAEARGRNAALGLTEREAAEIVLSSMAVQNRAAAGRRG